MPSFDLLDTIIHCQSHELNSDSRKHPKKCLMAAGKRMLTFVQQVVVLAGLVEQLNSDQTAS